MKGLLVYFLLIFCIKKIVASSWEENRSKILYTVEKILKNQWQGHDWSTFLGQTELYILRMLLPNYDLIQKKNIRKNRGKVLKNISLASFDQICKIIYNLNHGLGFMVWVLIVLCTFYVIIKLQD